MSTKIPFTAVSKAQSQVALDIVMQTLHGLIGRNGSSLPAEVKEQINRAIEQLESARRLLSTSVPQDDQR
jgi:hypothetical protein